MKLNETLWIAIEGDEILSSPEGLIISDHEAGVVLELEAWDKLLKENGPRDIRIKRVKMVVENETQSC